jgi:hypothetical protein
MKFSQFVKERQIKEVVEFLKAEGHDPSEYDAHKIVESGWWGAAKKGMAIGAVAHALTLAPAMPDQPKMKPDKPAMKMSRQEMEDLMAKPIEKLTPQERHIVNYLNLKKELSKKPINELTPREKAILGIRY